MWNPYLRIGSLTWAFLTLFPLSVVGQSVSQVASPTTSFEGVIEALGGKERILGIQSYRASLIYSNYLVWRFGRQKDIEKAKRHYEKELKAWEKRAANKGDPDVEKTKPVPPSFPIVMLNSLEQQHHQLQVQLPAKARNIILHMGTHFGKEGDDAGLDIIEQDGTNRVVIRSGNDLKTQTEQVGEGTDLSYSLPLLGMMRDILLTGNFMADFKGMETVQGAPIQSYLLKVEQGPYAGQWNLRVDGSTRLPLSLEYGDGLPPFFLNSQGTLFSAEESGEFWPNAAGRPGKREVGKALNQYRQRTEFTQFFGGYRKNQGVLYPAVVKTSIILPNKDGDTERQSSYVFMSLDWNPDVAYASLREDLKPAVISHAPQPEGIAVSPGPEKSEAMMLDLLTVQRFYRQLVWSAVFTSNQYKGAILSSPRYIAISPDWARFYNLLVAFPERCGFRGKAVRVPGRSGAAFRNEAGHDSGMNPVTDSDFKPVTFRRLSEP